MFPPFPSPSRPKLLSRPGLFRALLALALLAATPLRAEAQDAVSDFFGSLFGAHHAPPPQAPRRRVVRRPKPARVRPSRPAAAETRAIAPEAARQPLAPPAPKPPASFFVAVIGDSEAEMLAQGLAEAFADDPRVAILNKAHEDSGLVRDDFFDWRKAAKELLDGPQHIDVAVIEVGINDNQKLRLGNASLDPLSKPFNEIYAKRVEEIAAAFHDKNVPLVWVGLPIMRSPGLSNAALVFNDIDRQYAGALGAHFVDLWEPFTGVNSVYKASGPDVNGEIVRLRAADGVHFNKAGARKAAHFVEPEIRHVLEAKLQPPPAPGEAVPPPSPVPGPTQAAPPNPSATPEAAKTQDAKPQDAKPQPAAPPPKPLAGKVEPLTEPAVAPDGVLANLPATAPAPQAAPPQPDRADDFHWPAK